MSAPALVLLGYGSRDERASRVVDAYADILRRRRADLAVEVAYLAHSTPSLADVVQRLAASGHDEVVVVPLLLTGGRHADRDVPAAVAAAQAVRGSTSIVLADRLGLRPAWLSVLDERLRSALRRDRVGELDALVLACAGSADPLVNAAVARLGRQWSQHHRLPVTTAYAAVAPPSPGEAVRALRSEGRRYVAVGSFFLAPGVMSDRTRELAAEAGAVSVSTPLGVHDLLAEELLHRYQVAALGALNLT